MAKTIPASFDLQAIFLASCELDRQRTVKGWTAEHDAEHSEGELAQAAICYLQYSDPSGAGECAADLWPWTGGPGFKPEDHEIDNVRKAAGLCLAELARLLRKKAVFDQVFG